ncbi:hypothetical protein [Chryseobacterium pennipullorum]|uniref:hypothetical protein n=1 Tax=Chryseobacterium pennipullorum TaxID=2258963 RepID=UPI001401D184|nr:hypothetical protein [Chryseobacterium pennipullorum]
MKKLNIQKRKLTKSELKEINGGIVVRCRPGFCIHDSGMLEPGLVGEGGYCC